MAGPPKVFHKRDFPVAEVRRFLEPGPIVLVSSAWKGERNIMTLGWHMVMGFEPSLLACYIWEENHSFSLIRRSRQCVINLPAAELVDTVVGIGNCSGTEGDKFERFGLTAQRATQVDAPLIGQCHSSFECKLHDGSQVGKHGLFIWEVVKAHVAATPKIPTTLHYRGEGRFMVSGPDISRRSRFKPGNL
ncbi:MAG: flavin reductase family protein [Lysobacteraceae bacterium]|nr:MAG: flavin reductase family protein [Xanthomonadaceae bacterium]